MTPTNPLAGMAATSPKPNCGTCRFWLNQGFCHRFPPDRGPHEFGSRHPKTAEINWCGEHKPKETDDAAD